MLFALMLVLVWVLVASAGAGADDAWPRCPAGCARAACSASPPRDDGRSPRLICDFILHDNVTHLSVVIRDDEQFWYCRWGALSDAAPRFPAPRPTPLLTLFGCQLPLNSSYKELLQTLNIATTRLNIRVFTPLSFDALLTKMNLTELTVHSDIPAKLENDFTHFDDTLKKLRLVRISMTADQLQSMRHVTDLTLALTDLEVIPDLSLFTRLERLAIYEPFLWNASLLATAPALRDLRLEDKAEMLTLPSLPLLNNATFVDVYAMERIFGNCSNLENLLVERGSLIVLPAGWLAGCARLRRLRITQLPRLRKLPPRLLAGTTALRHLDLSRNALEALPGTLLADAVTLNTLDLNHNTLSALPKTLLANAIALKTLNLSHNTLSALPETLLANAVALNTLDLSHNTLSALPKTLLANTVALTTLDLSHNTLSALPETLLANAVALNTLDLSHNTLSALPETLLANAVALNTLDLSHNTLSALAETLLAKDITLTTLNLSHNTLSALAETLLAKAVALTTLDLSHNTLSALPETLLANAVALTTLDLSHNMLSALPETLLAKAVALNTLVLSHNKLSALLGNLLEHTEYLTHLDFSHNQIAALSGTLLSSTLNLKHLDLSHNQLASLPNTFCKSAVAIASDLNFDLSYNQLREVPSVLLDSLKSFKNINFRHNDLKF